MKTSIIVFGATGMVGSELVRQALDDASIAKITAIARRELDITHPKLTVIIHEDFLGYKKLIPVFKKHDAVIWCLGISQSQVNQQEYYTITHDYTIAAAKAIKKANPNMRIVFLSGEGARQDGKATFLFGRVKGQTEKDLVDLKLKQLYIARPAGIRPMHRNDKTPFLYKLIIPFYPFIELLFPSFVIRSTDVAKALLALAKSNQGKVIFSSNELKDLAKLNP